MKLCVFQGTFNPIHRAHLQVADYVSKNYDFDKILFIPAFKPPHKDYDPKMSFHRFNMVKLAAQGKLNFDVSDIEFSSDNKSYTYNTIRELYKIYDIEGKINFIIGTDAFEKIESWYETDKLKKLVHFIVFRRTNDFTKGNYDYLKQKGYDFSFAELDFCDISSTQLRSRIANGEKINDIVTSEVEDYIKENGLYKN